MNLLLIDHEDSFTYNLAHLLDDIQPTIVSNYYEIDVEITNGSNTYDLISKIEITSTGPKVYMRKIGKYL